MIVYLGLTVALIALILTGFPVGFGAGLVATAGAMILFGDVFDPRVSTMIARLAISKIDNFLLLAIPFFLLAGRLMNTGGITDRLFGFVAMATQPLKGGLGHANIGASVLFAGMSGSATADAVGLGTIEMRAMLANGYDRPFSAGVTAASSLISPVIPPSIVLVAYAVQAEVSVAAMFFAAIVPGLMLATVFMAYVSYRAWRDDYPTGPWPRLVPLARAFANALLPLLTPLIIIGGIYAGIFTPTEAAAVAALYATLLGVFVYRAVGPRQLWREVRGALVDSAVIMLIIVFTSAFGVIMIRAQVAGELAATLSALTGDPTVLLFLLTGFWLLVGFFMAQTPAVLLLTPILLPTANAYGIDLVHMGIVMSMTLTSGLLTPPVGMVLYALVRVTKVSFEKLAILCLPYVALAYLVIATLILMPDLVLYLPRALL